ncbi:MAG: hypothetical protein ACKV19_24765 [Verrucomicrobiales bacterium]
MEDPALTTTLDPAWSAPLLVTLFVLAVMAPGLWCLLCLLLSRIGGWHRLALRFPAREGPKGKKRRFQSAQIGWVNYSNCLTISAEKTGLYLSVLFLFRLGQPPLLVPWSAIRNRTTRKFPWGEIVAFDVGSPPIATVKMANRVFEELDAETRDG